MDTAIQAGSSTCSGLHPIHPCPLPLMGCCFSHRQPVDKNSETNRQQEAASEFNTPPLCVNCTAKPRVGPGGSWTDSLCADCYEKECGPLSDAFHDVGGHR